MRKRPTFVGLGLVWLVVVVAVSALTWTVIDAAGREVLTSGEASALPTEGAVSSADATPRGGNAGSRRSSEATPSTRPTRTPSPAGTSAGPPSPAGTPTRQPTTGAPRPSDTATVPAPQSRTGSWQGGAGTVAVSCRGAGISLDAAYPSDGWRIELKKRGSAEVDVEFESGGDDERKIRVRAQCGGGVPHFRVDAD